MPNQYSILDDQDRVYGEWLGHLHCALMYQSRDKADRASNQALRQ